MGQQRGGAPSLAGPNHGAFSGSAGADGAAEAGVEAGAGAEAEAGAGVAGAGGGGLAVGGVAERR